VILQGAGHDLRCRRRAAIDQHDERLAAGEVARLGVETLGLVRIAAPDRYDLATLQERVGHRNRLIQKSARVVAQIENITLDALRRYFRGECLDRLVQPLGGGVASIASKDGVNAYGVIWAVSLDELKGMDQIENPQAYERVQKLVVREDGQEVLCNVYIAFPQGDIAPDQPYLELIIQAAESAGLPEHWIARIKQYRVSE
jgi:hypothetical protein